MQVLGEGPGSEKDPWPAASVVVGLAMGYRVRHDAGREIVDASKVGRTPRS